MYVFQPLLERLCRRAMRLSLSKIGDRDIPGVDGEELTRVALAELADVFGTVVQSEDIR